MPQQFCCHPPPRGQYEELTIYCPFERKKVKIAKCRSCERKKMCPNMPGW